MPSRHEPYMQRCLQLAQSGAGYVAPNPMVGAVLVYQDRIIGEGYHQVYGQAHAEVNCLESVAAEDLALIPESTLYVSLEPCAHFGKTPPCADLIIRNRIKKVVVGCRDPFTEVDGKGIDKLISAGIQVEQGVLEAECKLMNKRFFCFHQKKRPYIILKWAESANSCIAGKRKERISISGDLTNRLVHRWRTEEAAIAIGTETALNDNPMLTARLWPGPQPQRILLDKSLKIPATSSIFSKDSPTIIFNSRKSGTDGHLRYIHLNHDTSIVQQMMQQLYEMKILSVIIEGGTKFLQAFIDEQTWDEARIITNPALVINYGYEAPKLNAGQPVAKQQSGNDLLQFFTNS